MWRAKQRGFQRGRPAGDPGELSSTEEIVGLAKPHVNASVTGKDIVFFSSSRGTCNDHVVQASKALWQHPPEHFES